MRRKTVLAVLGAIGLVLFALTAWLVITPPARGWASADEVVLFSVDGRDVFQREAKPAPVATGETVHGYPVLGKVTVDDRAERRRLEAAFRQATAVPGPMAKCFWPRHVVRLRHGTTVTDYVICFQCSQYERRVNDLKPERAEHIARDARPAFDAPLLAAGVRFAPE